MVRHRVLARGLLLGFAGSLAFPPRSDSVNAGRFFLALGAALLAAIPAQALWSPTSPTDTLWRRALTAPVLLVRTGDARFDDAIEEGFRQSWTWGSWSWVPDSGLGAVARDTTVLVFRLAEPWSPLRKTREEDCLKLSGKVRDACRADQSKSFFGLGILGRDLRMRSGTWLLTAPSQVRQIPLGDAMTVDIVREFSQALAVWQDSSWSPALEVVDTRYWAQDALVRGRREKVRGDTLWVPSEFAGKLGGDEASQELGSPVRFLPMRDLETRMGGSTPGYYLEPGLRPAATRYLRVRDLRTGTLAVSDDGPVASMSDTLLRAGDFRRLAHRLEGDEWRPRYMASVAWEMSSTELNGWVFQGGYELYRSIWGLAGWSNLMSRLDDGNNPAKQGHLIVGARLIPSVKREAPWLGPAMAVGTRLWIPVGDGQPDGGGNLMDMAPMQTLDLDYLGPLWFAGLSFQKWWGTNKFGNPADMESAYSSSYYGNKDELEASTAASFRIGVHLSVPAWGKGRDWPTAREVAAKKTRKPRP